MRNVIPALVGAFLLFSIVATAQQPQRCATDEVHARHLATQPGLQAHAQAWERTWAQQSQHTGQRGGVRKIPVVVHIIQSTTLINISDARVLSQIDVLNEDFRKLNADTSNIPGVFQGVASDFEIEFCLATIDPNGCPTTGINRIVSPANANHDQNDEVQLKGLAQWPPRRYLNIWVPETMADLLGYATFPTSLNFAPSLDGVVINGENFGRGNGTPPSSYALGRTATHEIGHWLGLPHTFQGGCAGNSPSNCATAGDGICDTPPTANSNFGCPNTQNTCTETPTDLPDQTTNYMDYGDDGCLNLFTDGQKSRVYLYLDNIRDEIWSPANLTATGCDGTVSPGCSPLAAFSASSQNGCAGVPITYTDHSVGPPSSWQWTFTGGTPSSSASPNPTVVYAQSGFYDVKLVVTNAFGQDSVQEFGYITISDPVPTPLTEGFEGILNLPQGWYTQDGDGQGTWQLATTTSSAGQNSMVQRNFDHSANPSTDALISEPVSLAGLGATTMTYDWAYKRRNAFAIDSFWVWISPDCGTNWTKVRQKAGISLVTVAGSAFTTPYVPASAAEWKTDTIDLSSFGGAPALLVKFECRGGGGQNLYIDQVNLDGIVGREEAKEGIWNLAVVPNPSAEAPEVHFQLPQGGSLELGIYSVDGRQVYSAHLPRAGAGTHVHPIPAATYDGLPAGIYFLHARMGQHTQHVKLVKAQ